MNRIEKKHNVLVTGAGGPAGVNAIRLLSLRDDVHICATDIDPLAAGQLHAHQFETMERLSDRVAYNSSLQDLLTKWNIDVLIPTVHEELFYVRDAKGDHPSAMFLSSQEALRLGDDKHALYEWASTHVPEYIGGWQLLSDELRLEGNELFLKPVQGRGARGCRVITRDEAAFLREHEGENASNWLLMEVLPGTEWSVDTYIAHDGTFVYVVPRERLALTGGISIKGKTVRHEQVISQTKDLLSREEFRGPVQVQWKADKNSNPKLVEINPRLSGGLMITKAAGADPIDCMLRELFGEHLEETLWEEKVVVGFLQYQELNNE